MNLYQTIFKRSDDAILILEGEKIHDCNKSLCELWGDDLENNIIGHAFERLFSSDYLSSRGNLLNEFRSFNHSSDTEKSLELSVSTLQNKTFSAEITFTKLSLNDSGKEQSKQGSLSIVTFKAKTIDRAKKIDLDGQKFRLSCESLSTFISQLFEQSPVGIIVNDLKSGKFLAANPAFLEALQYNKAELLALSFDDITPVEYRNIDRSALESMNKTGSFSVYRKEYVCKDSSRITVAFYGGIIVQGAQQDFIWSFVEDISDAEQIEKNFRKKLNLLNLTSQQTHTGVWELDISSGDLHWSDEIYRIFEIDKETFDPSYEAFLALIHPADKDKVNEAYQQSLTDQKPYQIVHRLQMPDGRIKFVDERCTTTFDEKGKPLVSFGSVQDITSANNSRTELERCPILEASQDFIGIYDLEGRVTFINQAGCQMIGETLDLDSNIVMINDLYAESNQELLASVIMPALISIGSWHGDLKLNNLPESNTVLVECRAFRVDNPLTGEPICYAAVSQNITKKRAAELELQAYKESLEQRINERTAALVEANRKAEMANNAKSVFLSRMSHELRTPLNAVLGFSQLIKGELSQESLSQHESINEVLLAGGHLLNLINDILDISNIERGIINIDACRINITQVMQQSLKSLSSFIEQQGIQIVQDDLQDVYVKGDTTRILQVLNNILTNAVKYNKPGGTINISYDMSSKRKLSVVITDSGIGISKSNLQRIFQPFERVDYALCDGSGIGLTLSYELMLLMGGMIEIDSSLGQGTRVNLEFNLASAEDIQELTSNTKQGLSISSSKIKILYIEDVPANIRLMRRSLSKLENITFLEAENGKSGVEIAYKELPSLILLDINLPDIDGFEVLKQLKSNKQTKDTPIIAVSANAFLEDIEDALKQGFDEYITKPFEHAQLLAKISSFI